MLKSKGQTRRKASLWPALLAGLGVGVLAGVVAVVVMAPERLSSLWPGQKAGTVSEDCTAGTLTQVNFLTCWHLPVTATMAQQRWDAVTFAASLGDELVPFLRREPWPGIAPAAKTARVPVMMYHDILPEKQVFFDVTPQEFEAHLQLIQEQGLTPVSLDALVTHLRTGLPLPPKPILLTFDDGYAGHYEYVYPLLKKYNYPASFGIYTKAVGETAGRPKVTWAQLREMVQNPLITITSHSVTHPGDLRSLDDTALERELTESKEILERELGKPIYYFTYPVGYYDDRVKAATQKAGYLAALTMRNGEEFYAGQSGDLLTIERFGQSRLPNLLSTAWGGASLAAPLAGVDFRAEIGLQRTSVEGVDLVLVSGGRPITYHADSRYQVEEFLPKEPRATAVVDGGFFSLESLTSNIMIGPVYAQNTRQFIPGGNGDNPKLKGRPLVVITPKTVQFLPFDPLKHNTLAGIQAQVPGVTDLFVASAWLVKDGQPRDYASFENLFGFDAYRHRAFWGLNQSGQPMIGISTNRVDSVNLGRALAQAGFREAVMLDSGASAALAYQGKRYTEYEPRPTPHAVLLVPPATP
ncbi:polysaccharide deacetylase [Gloeomargarita lithophora Alchichica-D10]|uniref:Polysaccharide deacetylase n=1 Tax=Gloeomargarita lithophora Alchichica-D10 TaxID=1188229 RepID=A0A1J0A8V0_9CYAN|nr:polysaccharide deacetylase family protein [Gloeomargarita lithophora]APB32362.1 polysaccharide deacetylase [Gloeomargarita lithophora Alchichica-D10]